MVITGQFLKWIYRRDDNGYTVAAFAVVGEKKDHNEVTVTGYLPVLDKDFVYELTGEYVEHPRYGMQFRIDSFRREPVSDESHLITLLSGPDFVGIGKKMATAMVETLGVQVLQLIKDDPSCLDRVPKMNSKHKKAILDGIAAQPDDRYAFLTTHGLTMKNILRLENFYGGQLVSVITEDPYDMVKVEGIGFKTADKFASTLGVEPEDPRRLTAWAGACLMEWCMQTGDSYLLVDDFTARLDNLWVGMVYELDDIIFRLSHRGIAVIEQDRIYPESQYTAEKFISGFLSTFPSIGFEPISADIIATRLTEVEQQLGIVYQEKQKEAIEAFFSNDLMILTGGPGTGKTTIVRGMVKLCRLLYPEYTINLCAPTGRAAKRLAELTDCETKTVHSLLHWDLETNTFGKNENDPLNVDLLIIDEFSMVDQWLFYNLLKAGQQIKKIILIGDSDQLPSVGMGRLLQDFIESDLYKVVKLVKIYRQQEGSDIISLASSIKNDECEEVPEDKDIRFFECHPSDVRRLVLEVVGHALNCYEDLQQGLMNVQVLAPKYAGVNGIDSLNVALQKEFNPPDPSKAQLVVGYRTYREGDKILQLKNQPDDDVFNGDIGILGEVIPAELDEHHQNRLIVDFDGTIVEYTNETFPNITHAYCVSIHKAQGSEYPVVIMPVVPEYGLMLQKKLLYTGITRANRNLILIGSHQAFFTGLNRPDPPRHSTLKKRLLELQSKKDA